MFSTELFIWILLVILEASLICLLGSMLAKLTLLPEDPHEPSKSDTPPFKAKDKLSF